MVIVDYIAAYDPGAAARMDQLFSDSATSLARLPLRGRPGTIAGTRELISHGSCRPV
ncbi:MAG: type II toxin-antitoxin system RelE/ParE family toxin [Guyparkeria sp.]